MLSAYNRYLTQGHHDREMRDNAETISAMSPQAAVIVDRLFDLLASMDQEQRDLLMTTMGCMTRDMSTSSGGDFYVMPDPVVRLYTNADPHEVPTIREFLHELAVQVQTRSALSLVTLNEDLQEALGVGAVNRLPIQPITMASLIPMAPTSVTDEARASAAGAAAAAAALGHQIPIPLPLPIPAQVTSNMVPVPTTVVTTTNTSTTTTSNTSAATMAPFAVSAPPLVVPSLPSPSLPPHLASALLASGIPIPLYPLQPPTLMVGHIRVYGNGTIEDPYHLDSESQDGSSEGGDSVVGMITSDSSGSVDGDISSGGEGEGDRNVRARV